MKKLILMTSITAIAPITLTSCGTRSKWISNVDEVFDGDTLSIDGKSIRLFGVDTPELHNQYAEFQETEGIEKMYALEAKRFTEKFVGNRKVLVKPITEDKYGRYVAKIKNKYDLGIELIKAGLARVAFISLEKGNPFMTTDSSYYRLLLETQYQAYSNSRGIWAHKDLFKTIFPKA